MAISRITSNAISGIVSTDKGGTGATTLTAENVIIGNGTSAVKFVAPGTTGNVLTSNGSAWVSQAISAGGDYIQQVYTSPATWSKPTGLKAVKVTVIGGGGGGGGAPGPATTTQRAGTGAGAGGASIEYIPAPSIPGPVSVTVGAGGSTGSSGGTSSFGPFCSATGGGGGNTQPSSLPTLPAMSGGASGAGSGGDINVGGEAGGATSFSYSQPNPDGTSSTSFSYLSADILNHGGSSLLGAGGRSIRSPQTRTAGNSGVGFGAGGGGCSETPRGPKSPFGALAGGSGGAGAVIVEEFY